MCWSTATISVPVDDDFVHLFSSWFNRGFLVLRRIDWSTPAIVLEKIIRYEAVHEIRDWDDLRRRIDPADRRCYALLPSGAGGRAADLRRGGAYPRYPGCDRADPGHRARGGRDRQDATPLRSIRSPIASAGLAGVSFGNFLIKQVVEEV